MSDDTGIEWTKVPGYRGATWNPVRGCTKISPGCKHCYAATMAKRVAAMERAQGRRSVYVDVVRGEEEAHGGHWNGRAKFLPERLAQPLKWRKPCRVFVNSMSDLFHDDITFEQIAAVFGVMAATPRHTYQVLTKRPQRAREFFAWLEDDRIGALPPEWNRLVMEQDVHPTDKLLHYTVGTPCFKHYRDCDHADEWQRAATRAFSHREV
jgi:protein gp37